LLQGELRHFDAIEQQLHFFEAKGGFGSQGHP